MTTVGPEVAYTRWVEWAPGYRRMPKIMFYRLHAKRHGGLVLAHSRSHTYKVGEEGNLLCLCPASDTDGRCYIDMEISTYGIEELRARGLLRDQPPRVLNAIAARVMLEGA